MLRISYSVHFLSTQYLQWFCLILELLTLSFRNFLLCKITTKYSNKTFWYAQFNVLQLKTTFSCHMNVLRWLYSLLALEHGGTYEACVVSIPEVLIRWILYLPGGVQVVSAKMLVTIPGSLAIHAYEIGAGDNWKNDLHLYAPGKLTPAGCTLLPPTMLICAQLIYNPSFSIG